MVAPPTNSSPPPAMVTNSTVTHPIREYRFDSFITVNEAYARLIYLIAIPPLTHDNGRPSQRELLDEMDIDDEIVYLQTQLRNYNFTFA
jgi:hypothetical protein